MNVVSACLVFSGLFALAAPMALAQQDKPVAPMVKSGQPAAERGGEASRGASASRGAGSIRASEARERQIFRRLDANGDGYLSGRELDARRAERHEWLALDRDRDGRISPDEFAAIADR